MLCTPAPLSTDSPQLLAVSWEALPKTLSSGLPALGAHSWSTHPGSTSSSCHLQLPNSSLLGREQLQAREASWSSSGTLLPAQGPGTPGAGTERAQAALPSSGPFPSPLGLG